jgi:gluconolactonase
VNRLEKDGTRTVLANGLDGKKLSGPNDLVITKSGAIYFTDNDFGLRDAGKSPQKELQNGIWYVKDGKARMVLTDKELGGVPNGIALSPDEKYMYLSAFTKMKRYEVQPDGSIKNGMVFNEGPGIGDGIKVDVHGNLFSSGGAGPGIIRIISPQGKLLGTLNLPIFGGEPKKQWCATNDTFGDRDSKTLYVSGCDVIFKIRLKTTGIVSGPPR